MNKETDLSRAANQVKKTFANDLKLVAEAAKNHGITTTNGGVLHPPRYRAYNLRLPNADNKREMTALVQASTVLVGYIDSRQSADIVDHTRADVWILIAGGATQPQEYRQNSLVDLLSLIYTVNPSARFILLGHNHICGGINHYTGGRIAGMSPSEEYGELTSYLKNFGEALIARDVPSAAFSLGVVQIDRTDRFSGIKFLG